LGLGREIAWERELRGRLTSNLVSSASLDASSNVKLSVFDESVATRKRNAEQAGAAECKVIKTLTVGSNMPASRGRMWTSLLWKRHAMEPADTRMDAGSPSFVILQTYRANESNASRVRKNIYVFPSLSNSGNFQPSAFADLHPGVRLWFVPD
jgi:hypothetical protein